MAEARVHRRSASSAATADPTTWPWGLQESAASCGTNHPTIAEYHPALAPLFCAHHSWTMQYHAIPQFNRTCSKSNAQELQMRNANPIPASNLLQTKCTLNQAWSGMQIYFLQKPPKQWIFINFQHLGVYQTNPHRSTWKTVQIACFRIVLAS